MHITLGRVKSSNVRNISDHENGYINQLRTRIPDVRIMTHSILRHCSIVLDTEAEREPGIHSALVKAGFHCIWCYRMEPTCTKV